ncbi:MAG: hypothetical protein QOI81_1037, partial [Actinomycetota bacterium]|nr:hypothetical protein [Actinomycetota bacterium]
AGPRNRLRNRPRGPPHVLRRLPRPRRRGVRRPIPVPPSRSRRLRNRSAWRSRPPRRRDVRTTRPARVRIARSANCSGARTDRARGSRCGPALHRGSGAGDHLRRPAACRPCRRPRNERHPRCIALGYRCADPALVRRGAPGRQPSTRRSVIRTSASSMRTDRSNAASTRADGTSWVASVSPAMAAS